MTYITMKPYIAAKEVLKPCIVSATSSHFFGPHQYDATYFFFRSVPGLLFHCTNRSPYPDHFSLYQSNDLTTCLTKKYKKIGTNNDRLICIEWLQVVVYFIPAAVRNQLQHISDLMDCKNSNA